MKSRWLNAAAANNGSTKKFEDRMIMLKMQGRERLGLTRYIPERKKIELESDLRFLLNDS